ncbi:phosphoenolpyruvate synthase [archaeon]|nr:phosphoenolpyruvate synthase [archaeon]
MKVIAWFNELDKSSISVAGGKGANLGVLTEAGFPVPPGFVVTAQAYEEFIKTTGVDKEIYELLSKLDYNDNEALQKASKNIKVIITSEEIPDNMKEEITEAYNKLLIGNKFDGLNDKTLELVNANKKKEPFVAVRSSATAEDLPEASFAGQQETFLNVKGAERVIESVKNCWASLFTPRAIYYRHKNDFPHDKVLIAVIVQKMIDSEKSGVAFSIHPSTGNKDEIVIEAGWGLGEFVVKGVINPDNYIVDKNTFKIKKKLVKKQTKMLTRDPLKGVNIEVEIPDQKQEKQVLDDEQIITLAKVMDKIEKHYDFAQDVEWASENNRLYIVQSRPVTFFGEEKKEGTADESEPAGEVLVKGLSASPGRTVGKVVIIKDESELDKVKKGDVLVTSMTDPDMVPAMERAGAIVTNEGGLTSHAAIVSRELGVPCIVGTEKATQVLTDGMRVTVDASSGVVREGGEEIEESATIKTEVKSRKDYSAPVTATKIYMNLGIPNKIEDYADLPFDGIGLMRIEFVIAGHKKHPLKAIEEGTTQEYVKKLSNSIAKVAGAIKPRPMILRFSDFKTNEYADLEGGEQYEPKENNPMIGWRGCSRYVSPDFEKAFRLECRAVKKVRDAGLKNVWVMLPFVRTVKEVKQVEKIMESEELVRSHDFKMFIMAEVPSVILLADEFAKTCDGFSIGSNDLTQLTLGVDRDSAKLGKMGYFDERDEAVKKSISHLIKAAHDNDITVSICGQAPSQYPEFTEFLVKEGIDSVSVNPDVIYSTRDLVSSVEKKMLLKVAREEKDEEWTKPSEKKDNPDWTEDEEEPQNDPRDHEDKAMFWP